MLSNKAHIPLEQLTEKDVIQTVEITTDCYVRLIFNSDRFKKDRYINVGVLIDLLDEDMKRVSDPPENKADKEHYIRSRPEGQPLPSWLQEQRIVNLHRKGDNKELERLGLDDEYINLLQSFGVKSLDNSQRNV